MIVLGSILYGRYLVVYMCENEKITLYLENF